MTKRMTALALAMLLLMTALGACAESAGTRLDLSKPKLTLRTKEGKKTLRLYNVSISLAAGTAEGVPTLQSTLDYGEQVDFVAQLAGSRLLLSMGGVYGTYYVDLADIMEDAAKGQLISTGIGAGLVMFGANPEAVLNLWMPKDAKNRRKLAVELSKKTYRPMAERFLSLAESAGLGLDVEALREGLYASTKRVKLRVVYDEDSGKIMFRISRDKERFQLDAKLTLTTEPMEFINISADEEQYDLLNLSDEVREGLESDLEFMAMKRERFVTGMHLDELTQDDAGAQ